MHKYPSNLTDNSASYKKHVRPQRKIQEIVTARRRLEHEGAVRGGEVVYESRRLWKEHKKRDRPL